MKKLYGVGVGPGAPDLVTVRALAVLRSVDVLALPRSNDWGESMAWKIVAPHFEGAAAPEKLFLTFPMNKDPERLRPALMKAMEAIGEQLAAGRSVAFVTEGDPSLYSTFVYVAGEARRRWPELALEVVPAVSSPMAVAAVTGVPLADGLERIAIVPANYGVEDLDTVLRMFDTVVLMKIGPEMPAIIAALERAGLLDRAVYVAKATMKEQRIVRDLSAVSGERGDCFAMVIVSKRERAGVLMGPPGAAGMAERSDTIGAA
jgi:precorrin-2/cobalt-factor-2 C20-methyltransferase